MWWSMSRLIPVQLHSPGAASLAKGNKTAHRPGLCTRKKTKEKTVSKVDKKSTGTHSGVPRRYDVVVVAQLLGT